MGRPRQGPFGMSSPAKNTETDEVLLFYLMVVEMGWSDWEGAEAGSVA